LLSDILYKVELHIKRAQSAKEEMDSIAVFLLGSAVKGSF